MVILNQLWYSSWYGCGTKKVSLYARKRMPPSPKKHPHVILPMPWCKEKPMLILNHHSNSVLWYLTSLTIHATPLTLFLNDLTVKSSTIKIAHKNPHYIGKHS